MKGLVKYKNGDGFVALQDVEDLPPAPNQVKVEVKAGGVCGSDIHVFHDHISIPIHPPVVMGHEFSGVIVEKGAEASDDIKIGDRVTGESSTYYCGKCRYCLSGYYNLCNERKILGYSSNGSFTRYCNVTAVHKLPDNVSFKIGAITELVACCLHGVIEQTGVSAGDFVVVTGPGPAGLCTSLLALAEGGIVLVCGTSADTHRLKLAEEIGVHYTVNIQEQDPLERVRELTEGYGADVIFECSGSASGVASAIEMVRKRGKFTQIGLLGEPIKIDFEKIAFKEIQMTGSISQRAPAWKRSLTLMGLRPDAYDRLISHEFPLHEWEQAFRMTEKGEGVKIIMVPE